MSSVDEVGLADAAHALRDEFDASFAAPPRPRAARQHAFIAVRVSAHPYAFRLSDIVRVYRDPPLLELMNDAPAFVGLARFHRTVAPVFALRALLGYGEGTELRWAVLTNMPLVGFAFDAFEGQITAPAEDVLPEATGEGGRRFLCGTVRVRGEARPIVHVPSLVKAIEETWR